MLTYAQRVAEFYRHKRLKARAQMSIGSGHLGLYTVAPVISGVAGVGNVLTCSAGTWKGEQRYSYEWTWYRKTGATGVGTKLKQTTGVTTSTYTQVAADSGKNIYCQVRKNIGGSSYALSNVVAVP